MLLRVTDLVRVRLAATRLVARRPHAATLHVAEEQVAAPCIASDVLPPAGHREVAPTAITRSRRGHHHRIPPVREHVRPRGLVVGGPETPQHRRNQLAHVRGAPYLVRSRPGNQDVARHPLLEQELGRLDDRRRVEAPDHHAVVEDVADGRQHHPLVVRHVAPHDGDRRALG